MDAEHGGGPISLSFVDAAASARVLTVAECAYVAAVEVPIFVECESLVSDESAWRRLCFHLLGVFIVFTLLVLTPLKMPAFLASTAVTLQLIPAASVQIADPQDSSVATAEPAVVAGEKAPRELQASPVAADKEPTRSVSEQSTRLGASILQSKVAVLQAWTDAKRDQGSLSLGEHQGQGTVFDKDLKARLSHVAPGRIAAGMRADALADVNGVQEVILGDNCFQVTKLDDQAMRGMGVWTRGHCQVPDAGAAKIKMGVLP